MPLTSTDTPELGSISIEFPNVFIRGRTLRFDHFLSYDYQDNYLVAADGWSFSINRDDISDLDVAATVPRTRVEVYIDGLRQSVGYVDDIKTRSSRSGGTVWTIEGRDWLAPAVDCHVDPKTRFSPTMTILEVLSAVFAPFGLKTVSDDATANRNAITGSVFGVRTSKKGKLSKQAINHLLKPYPNEGAFAFAERVANRAGMWIRPGADGETVFVGQPDFDQDARYQLRHRTTEGGVRNNGIEADVTQSAKDQPSVILASGFGGGGEFSKATLRGAVINPVVAADVSAIVSAYPEIKFVTPPLAASALEPVTEPGARPLYLYDPESHNQSQLNAFLLREISIRMRKSLTAKYTIEGHKLNGQPIAVDTIIDVDDDRSNLHLPLWIIGRHFSKAGGGQGTKTVIDCIRPGTLFLTPS